MIGARWFFSAPMHHPRRSKKKRHAERAGPGDPFRAGRTGGRGGAPGRAGSAYVGASAVHSAAHRNRIAQHIGTTATGLEQGLSTLSRTCRRRGDLQPRSRRCA